MSNLIITPFYPDEFTSEKQEDKFYIKGNINKEYIKYLLNSNLLSTKQVENTIKNKSDNKKTEFLYIIFLNNKKLLTLELIKNINYYKITDENQKKFDEMYTDFNSIKNNIEKTKSNVAKINNKKIKLSKIKSFEKLLNELKNYGSVYKINNFEDIERINGYKSNNNKRIDLIYSIKDIEVLKKFIEKIVPTFIPNIISLNGFKNIALLLDYKCEELSLEKKYQKELIMLKLRIKNHY